MNVTTARTLLEMFKDQTIGSFNTKEKLETLADIINTVLKDESEIVLTGATNYAVDTIKIIRGLTNMGLKESKDLYDAQNPNRLPGIEIRVPLPRGRAAAVENMKQQQDRGMHFNSLIKFQF